MSTPSLPELLEALAQHLRAEEERRAEFPLVKPAEVARRLAVDEATVYRLIRRGDLRGTRIAAGAVRVSEAEVARFIKARTAPRSAA